MGTRSNTTGRYGVPQYRALFLALCLIVFGVAAIGGYGERTSAASAIESLSQDAAAGTIAKQAQFLREFSGPQDLVKGLPPVVDRSMYILFCHAAPKPPGEKMSRPYSVTTDSTHRIFVTDPSEGLVHIFDFEKAK